jgi:hypothetical protein
MCTDLYNTRDKMFKIAKNSKHSSKCYQFKCYCIYKRYFAPFSEGMRMVMIVTEVKHVVYLL